MMKISFLIPSKHPDLFEKCLCNLSDTCSSKGNVEILVKVDSVEHESIYNDIAKGSDIQCKAICTPTTGYVNCHIMFEELVPYSSSEMLWLWGDDCLFVEGDWYKEAAHVHSKVTKKVFALKVPNIRKKRWFSLLPIISKDWLSCLKGFRPPVDYSVGVIARDNNCYYPFEDSDIKIQIPCTPNLTSKSLKRQRIIRLNKDLPNIKKQINLFEKQ